MSHSAANVGRHSLFTGTVGGGGVLGLCRLFFCKMNMLTFTCANNAGYNTMFRQNRNIFASLTIDLPRAHHHNSNLLQSPNENYPLFAFGEGGNIPNGGGFMDLWQIFDTSLLEWVRGSSLHRRG